MSPVPEDESQGQQGTAQVRPQRLGGPPLPPLCKVLRASDKQHRSFMVCVGHHAKVQLRPELGPCLSTFVYVTLSWAHGRILG